MASLNKVTLIGNVGKDPETRYMPNGDAVTNLTLATTETWKDKSGEKKEKTEWHRVVLYRKLGELAAQYVVKGSSLYIEGRIETNKYTDKEGVEKYSTQIVGAEMKFLGGRTSDGAAKKDDRKPAPSKPASKPARNDDDLDIPF